MKNNRIIFPLWQDKPGGIELSLPEVAAKSPNFVFSAFVCRPNDKGISVFDGTNVNFQYGCSDNLRLYIRFFLFAYRNRHKVFHTFNIGPSMLILLRAAGARKIVYSIRGTVYWKTLVHKFFVKICWRVALGNKIVFMANSKWSKKVFYEKISRKVNVRVTYNYIDSERFRCSYKKREKPYKVIYSGRLAHGKNLFKWLDCAKKILEVHSNTSFKIYGEGPLKSELEFYSRSLGISDSVVFEGFKPDIEKAYQDASLLLFLSEYESFGNVVVESIMCGTPVIVSRIPSMEEIFQNYNEFLVSLDDQLEDNIITKLSNHDELSKLALKVRSEFLIRFSLQEHLLKLHSLYRSFEIN